MSTNPATFDIQLCKNFISRVSADVESLISRCDPLPKDKLMLTTIIAFIDEKCSANIASYNALLDASKGLIVPLSVDDRSALVDCKHTMDRFVTYYNGYREQIVNITGNKKTH